MEVLYVIVPLAITFAGGGLLAYIWAVKSGQFDDLTTPGSRVILDDEQ